MRFNNLRFIKILACLFLFFLTTIQMQASIHFTESFTGAFPSTMSTGTYTLGSGTWDVKNIQLETAANSYGGVGGATRMYPNAAGSYIISPSVNSVGTITFKYREGNAAGGGGSFTVQKSVNGGAYTNIGTQSFSGTTYNTYSVTVNDLNNNIKIKVLYNSTTTYLIVDEMEVTNYTLGPNLTATPITLSNFGYVEGSGPSTSQSYNLSGTNLNPSSGNITVSSTNNFEVSNDNISFSTSINLPYSSSNLTSTPVYVRLRSGLTVNNYNSDTISNSGGGTTNVKVNCSGYVTAAPTPILNASTGSLSGFTYIFGSGPSTSQTFTFSGSNLTGSPGNITVTAPANYEISLNNSSFSSSQNIAYNSATLASTTIYVRLKAGLAVNTYNSALVSISGGGANPVDISCNGSVTPPPSPTLSVNPTSITGFTYIVGTGPSSSQSYTLSGSNLTGYPSDITVTAPTNYEISLNNSAFSGSINVAYSSATLASTTIYVRLKSGLAVNTYNSENITHAGGGATTVNVSCSGNVTTPPPPSLVVSPTSLSGFTYILGAGPSTSQSYTLSGSNLTGFTSDIIVTAPTNYEVSLNNSTFSNSLNVSYTSATLASTTIYVRLKSGLSVNTYNSENITHAGGGATTINVSCSGSVTTPPPPTLVVSPTSLTGFTYILGAGPSTSQSYTLSGSNLTGFTSDIIVTAPTNYEVSLNNSTFSNSLNVTYTSATLASTTIYVRLKSGLSVNTYNSENITHAGGGATTVNVSCSGSVTTPPPPSLVVSPTSLSGFTYILGAGPSTSQSYTLSGSNLTGFTSDIIVTAPTNYEVSLNNSTFSNSLNVSYSSATLASTTIYVRLKSGLAVNTYNSENITHAGGGATTVNVSCSGSVTDNSAPTTCISEGFNSVGTSGTPVPSNWTFTNIGGTYTTSGNYGASSPSVKLDLDGDIIETPTVSNATQLKFWIKGQTATGSYLLVEGYNGSTWSQIDNILLTSITTGTTKTYSSASTPALIAGYKKFRFTYDKSSGNLAFDDVEVLCSGAASPNISVSPSSLAFGNQTISTTSTEKTFTLTGTDLTADINLTAPSGYEISKTTNSGFATNLTYTPASGSVNATVYVRFKPTAAQAYNGNITNVSSGATTQNVAVTGTGILPTYTVNFSVVNGNGSIAATVDGNTISTGANIQEGKNIVFTATPNANYRVKEWKLNNSVIAGNTTNTYTLTSINANATVSVEFELIPITNYTINFSVVNGNGSIAATVDGNTISTGANVQEGKNIVFTATPSNGYRVKEWKLNSSVIAGNTTNTYTLTSINANATVSVEFELIPITSYTVNFSVVNGNGSISATVDGNTISSGASVQEGDNIVFTAIPSVSYQVKEWKLNSSMIAGNTTNTYTLTSINADATVSVEFELANGISNINFNEIKIFPIPALNEINIESNLHIYKLMINNLNGQIIQNVNFENNKIDISNLSNGIYILQIITNKGIFEKKIEVTK